MKQNPQERFPSANDFREQFKENILTIKKWSTTLQLPLIAKFRAPSAEETSYGIGHKIQLMYQGIDDIQPPQTRTEAVRFPFLVPRRAIDYLLYGLTMSLEKVYILRDPKCTLYSILAPAIKELIKPKLRNVVKTVNIDVETPVIIRYVHSDHVRTFTYNHIHKEHVEPVNPGERHEWIRQRPYVDQNPNDFPSHLPTNDWSDYFD